MKRQTLAIDADDTLFDENTAVRLFMNKTYGFQHTAQDYLVPGPFDNYWERIWNVEPDKMNEMYEQFVTSSEKQNLEPMPGAVRVLEALKEKYELVIVTSRDHRAVDWTHDSLTRHYPQLFKDVHFTPLWGKGEKVTKAKICNEIGASYLIDDSFEHCKLAAEAGIQSILFGNYGWNREQELPQGIVRCQDWTAVGEFLLTAND
jgi:uncharacterized HAD superfamily protein